MLEVVGVKACRTRTVWRDGEKGQVEDLLNSFIATCVLLAEKRRLEELEHERIRREWDEQCRREQEASARQEQEAARVKDLNDRVERWRWAKLVREFADAVEADALTREGRGAVLARVAAVENDARRSDGSGDGAPDRRSLFLPAQRLKQAVGTRGLTWVF